MRDPRPTHVTWHPGDKLPLCGRGDRHGPALPVVTSRHVAAHVAGYGMPVCPECAPILVLYRVAAASGGAP